jgi:3-oxoacyl-[acyl-carrier protein] reductase
MKYIQYLKRGIKYILNGQPTQKVYAQITYLSPSDLLKGRTALITGGTSGIGYEIAKAFINAGAICVITGRDEDKVQRACEKINKEVSKKDHIFGLSWDVTDVKGNRARLQKALKILNGRNIDILVNNAGLVGGEIKDCTEEKYDSILNTNLKGSFFMAQLIAEYMKENSIKGNILNIGSSSSLRPATSAYTITKWGIRGMTKGLAKILSPYGITVNAIAPGPTATPMLMPNGIKDDISFPTNPLGRFIMPGEIANMAVFLVSNMGRSIIGSMVFMTGGSGVVTYDDVHYSF